MTINVSFIEFVNMLFFILTKPDEQFVGDVGVGVADFRLGDLFGFALLLFVLVLSSSS